MNSAEPPSSISKKYSQWGKLEKDFQDWQSKHLRDVFEQEPDRAKKFNIKNDNILFDFSKTHLSESTLNHLITLAEEADLKTAINAMFQGDRINNTENRKVLHVALRSGEKETEEEKLVQDALHKMSSFIDAIHSDTWLGFSDKPITDVVNIGIGGSDLGARMAVYALKPFSQPHTRVHFVTNVDGADLLNTLENLNPESTLFIVASKTFTTLETLTNATSAREWLLKAECPEDAVNKHFVAISSNSQKAVEFGIAEDNIFPMWDWVGGRYSMWSAIGLPIALSIGYKNFKQLLSGAKAMDDHFATAPFAENLPVVQALLTFWYSQFWGYDSEAVLPYNHLLAHFPDYLQQLDMESLGKSITKTGDAIDYQTGLIIWGSEGTNGQHSFHQLLHQGTQKVLCDFIVNKKAQHNLGDHQLHLFSCCLSQSQALMQGRTEDEAYAELIASGKSEPDAKHIAPHKVIPGNRPSTTLLIDELTPFALGQLVALYEHKVFTLSTLLGINAFDQWGVELGKSLGTTISKAIVNKKQDDDSEYLSLDSSTQLLIDNFLQK